VQHVTLRVLLATASHKGLDIGQLDVKTAFLNGDLPGDIYPKLPNEVGGMVWKLHKALYGLKQAAHAWHAKLRDAMIDHGFVPSKHEPCLFLRGTGSNRVYVMVHVDDALLVGSTQAVRDAKRDMQKMFDTKDIGDARHFLGMTITRHEDGSYSLTQPKYVEDMLARFNLTDAKPVATPLPVGLRCQRMPVKRCHQIRPTKHLWDLCCI
jgi:hypothetical protein